MIIDPFYKQKSAAKPNNLLWHCAVKKWKQQPHCWVNIYDSVGFSSTRSRNVWCDSGLEPLPGCPSPPCATGKQPPGPTGALCGMTRCPLSGRDIRVCHGWLWMVWMGDSLVLGNRIAHVSTAVFAKQKYFPADVMKCIWMSSPGKFFNSFQSCY